MRALLRKGLLRTVSGVALVVGLTAVTASGAENYPKLAPPQPRSFDEILPSASPVRILETVPVLDPQMRKECFGNVHWVPLSTLRKQHWSFDPGYRPFPSDLYLQHRDFYEIVSSEKFDGPISVTRSYEVQNGTSVTDTQTMSAEISAKVGDISAKLSETLGHSVTVTTEHTEQKGYKIDVLQGRRRVWNVWRLVEVYAFVDKTGADVRYRAGARRGPSSDTPFGESCSIDLPFPTMRHPVTMVGKQADFPKPLPSY